jgi:hypothetical protein
VMNAGTASISQAGPGALTIAFPGYEKANDALKITCLRLAGAPRDGARSKKSYLYLCRRYDITRACPPSAGDRPATNVTI